MPFTGLTTALISPFFKGELDIKSFLKLLEFQTESGITQFVLASTTGENSTLEDWEIERLCQEFKKFKSQNKRPLKFLMATGSPSTKHTIEKTKKAYHLGADAALVVTPYYNKPSQQGLWLHYQQLAEQSPLPLILYNVPSRTACSLDIDTTLKLSQIKNIIGIKEATGDMDFLKQMKKLCPENFLLLSGDDSTCKDFFDLGGGGAISAAANILPKELREIYKADKAQRKNLFAKYQNFIKELFKETNPVGVKQVLYEKGLIRSPELRLPLIYSKNPALSSSCSSLDLFLSKFN